MDTIVKSLFGFLLLFGILIIALWLSDVPENSTGLVDTTYPTLNRSGETVISNPTVKWLSYLFGVGIISIFGFMLFIGSRKKEELIRKQIYRMLTIGIGSFLLVYTLMVQSWWNYVATNNMDYFMGLPKPTAWMLFGIMLTPFFIAYCYATKFEAWIYSEENEKRFAEIMAKRKEKENNRR